MKLVIYLALYIGLALNMSNSFAESIIKWQSTNVQFLKGSDYEVGDDQRTIITFEHSNKWRFGDFYTFIDHSEFKSGGNSTYAELTPRFSLSEITDQDVSFGPVTDIFLSAQLENGSGGISRYMMGIGANLSIPGFSFFKLNLFNRNNPDRADTTWQVYIAWKYPIKFGEIDMVIEGYADIFGEEGGSTVPHQSFVPRFLFDIGPAFSLPANTLQAGIEWQYWHNKFGIDGVTESVPQLQLKWTF